MGEPPQTPEQRRLPIAGSAEDVVTQPYGSAPAPSSGTPLAASTLAFPVSPTTSTSSMATSIMEEEVGRLTRQGYVIVDRGPTSVQLKRAKHFSILWALFWLVVVPGGGLFIYLAWYLLVKRDRIVFLRITPDGRVMSSAN